MASATHHAVQIVMNQLSRFRRCAGFVVDEEDEENPKMYVCCLKDLQADLKGMAGVNAGSLVCKYDEEEYSIRANAHRLRMDCEKVRPSRCPRPVLRAAATTPCDVSGATSGMRTSLSCAVRLRTGHLCVIATTTHVPGCRDAQVAGVD